MADKRSSCPLYFLWGTFCESVLQGEGTAPADFTSKSLINVRNTFRGKVQILTKPENEKSDLVISLGRCWVYAVFRRTEGVTGAFEVPFVIKFIDPRGEKDSLVETTVQLEELHDHIQLSVQVGDVQCRIPPDSVSPYRSKTRVEFISGQESLGLIEMPIILDFSSTEVRQNESA